MRIMLIGALLLTACASNSGVVNVGPDTYRLSRQAANGFNGMGNLRTEAQQEAGRACTDRGKTLRVISQTESKPPYVLGNYPKVDLTFACDQPAG